MSDWQGLSPAEWSARLARAGIDAALAGGLGRYLSLLGRWDSTTNLLGKVDARTLIEEHIMEALVAIPWLPATGTLLDLGSGNGIPAIPLLLARRGLKGVLLEPRERRWGFLSEAIRELDLVAEVRRERVAAHRGGPYAVLSVRALAAAAWVKDAQRLLAPRGVLLWWTASEGERLTSEGLLEPVVNCPLPVSRRGKLVVWRRRST
ncbi:MAG: RsmG family class I SAM-dependent methyltransferase [Acidobacteriota bacterium]